jgi:plasmid stabilization system protein ParE
VKYLVRISRPALHRVGDTYAFLREGDPRFADDWITGLYETFATLRTLPNRGRIAPESPRRGHTVRQILYRKYRVTYVVTDGRVTITSVRHSSLPPDGEEWDDSLW